MAAGEGWDLSPVPNEFVIYGVGPSKYPYQNEVINRPPDLILDGFEIVAQEENAILLEVGEGGNDVKSF